MGARQASHSRRIDSGMRQGTEDDGEVSWVAVSKTRDQAKTKQETASKNPGQIDLLLDGDDVFPENRDASHGLANSMGGVARFGGKEGEVQ